MTDPHAPDAVVAGLICLDIIPDLGQIGISSPGEFYTPGKLRNVHGALLSPGGPVSNTGLGLVKMGIRTALMGKVGQDPFGQILRTLLADDWGVREGMITAEDATTSYAIVVDPPGFDRMFLHCPGANDTFGADDVDYALVARTRLFHLGYPPLMRKMYSDGGAQLTEIFRRVKDLGVTSSLDMSLPDTNSPSAQVDWRALLADVLPHVDLFLPSAEEILFMLDRPMFDRFSAAETNMLEQFDGDLMHRLGQALVDMGAKIVGIKAGHRGIYLRTAGEKALSQIGAAAPGDAGEWAGRELWHPAYRIEGEPSATGSGDSAIAGFLSAYLRGNSPERALQCANGTGAFNVMAPDALSGIREWDELIARIESGWPTEPLTVTGPAWSKKGTDSLIRK